MNKNRGGIETKEKSIFADLTSALGERTWPASAFHIFANVTLVNDRQILLVLSEDRKERNIWTPPGGEVKVRDGQMPREAAVAEVYEEVGLKINPKWLCLIGEPQFIYPTSEYNPYNGVGIIILSYLHTKLWDAREIKLNRVPEKGCMIVDYRMVPLPTPLKHPLKKDKSNVWGTASDYISDLRNAGITVYPNYAEKLLEANEILILSSL